MYIYIYIYASPPPRDPTCCHCLAPKKVNFT